MNIEALYIYANKFYKLSQEDVTFNKKYVLDQFFNSFKEKYVILYDTVDLDYDRNIGDLFGPKLTFNFVEGPKFNNHPAQVSQEVTTALNASKIGRYIHALSVQLLSPKKYTCIIQFKPEVELS